MITIAVQMLSSCQWCCGCQTTHFGMVGGYVGRRCKILAKFWGQVCIRRAFLPEPFLWNRLKGVSFDQARHGGSKTGLLVFVGPIMRNLLGFQVHVFPSVRLFIYLRMTFGCFPCLSLYPPLSQLSNGTLTSAKAWLTRCF